VSVVRKLDYVSIPSQDAERSRAFYVDTLGLKPDAQARFEFWVGETCFCIWEPAASAGSSRRSGTGTSRCTSTTWRPRAPSWRPRGIEFQGEVFDTGVCHMAFFRDPDGNDLMLHHRYQERD
jgi:catechol 2,3-dioxygenase-like lactoylglutathione lyase family enzyme